MSWRESAGVAVMDVGQEVMACDIQWNHHQQHLRIQAQDQQTQQCRLQPPGPEQPCRSWRRGVISNSIQPLPPTVRKRY
jgi:hypothetical protein